MKIYKKFLGFILHHSNRNFSSPIFYENKKKCLEKHGQKIKFNIQEFPEIYCNRCGGSGIHESPFGSYQDDCWHCFNGIYKRKSWVILQKYQLGNYVFHIPLERVYVNPVLKTYDYIDGYIEHKFSKKAPACHFIFMLLYQEEWLSIWWKETGNGWRAWWWKPYNWIPNIIHVIKNGKDSLCFRKDFHLVNPFTKKPFFYKEEEYEDFPF